MDKNCHLKFSCTKSERYQLVRFHQNCYLCGVGPSFHFANTLLLSLSSRNLATQRTRFTFPQCGQCGENCAVCHEQKCTRCNFGYIRTIYNTCVIACPKGYFRSVEYNKCLQCAPNCVDCLDFGTCFFYKDSLRVESSIDMNDPLKYVQTNQFYLEEDQ